MMTLPILYILLLLLLMLRVHPMPAGRRMMRETTKGMTVAVLRRQILWLTLLSAHRHA